MKSRLYIIAVLSLVAFVTLVQAGSIFAGPACPYPSAVKQPDGTEFQAILKGDEFINWAETEDGCPIIINENTGFWEYGKLEPLKGLCPTGQVVGKDVPVGINKISAKDIELSMPEESFKAPGFSSPLSKSPQFQFAPLNITGPRKVMVILVNFTDRTLTTTEAQWVSRIFGATDSLKQYFTEVSYSQCTLVPAEETYNTANDGIVVVTLPRVHPSPGSASITNQQISKDALVAADSYINYASFDTNGSGTITTDEVHFVVVVAGFERSYTVGYSPPYVWAHKSEVSSVGVPVLDGKQVGGWPGGYIQFGELHGTTTTNHQATVGVIAHEFGHDCGTATIFYGLIDLYGSGSRGLGYWDTMASGSWLYTTGYWGTTPCHFSAWCKYYMGWLTPTQITTSANGVSFPQVETATGADRGVKQILNNPGGPEIGGTGEYFLIENRQKVGYDAALPGVGICIYHIDETQTSNSNASRKLVDLEEADGLNELDGSDRG
ncbi:MAG: M6 family metalloprotease domain-containing protein, partial [Planctomycetota bacterium]